MAGFHTTGPNEALIVSGGGTQPRVVVGGRVFVLPIIQRVQRLSLEVMTLSVETPRVYTKEGVPVSVDGVAQVKVARSEEAIRTAAQQFLGKPRDEIAEIALQTMEGHQRAMLGTLTVEAIYQDRDAFAAQVREVASTDMANMGLEIVSFTIRNIHDEQGYLDALGVKRTSEVKRDAAIGQAEAERDAAIKSAQAKQEAEAARFVADTGIADSERAFSVKKAAYDQEVNARKAEAELAYELQATKTRQQIKAEEIQVEVVDRQKQIEVQLQEVKRREQELEATVRKSAEAERYRLETLANAERARKIAEAEGEAEAIRLRGQAEADATRARGIAEADATKARGLAEAEAMEKKADAWKEYGQAAVVQQLLEAMPNVAQAIAGPLARTDRIVMISGGDSNGAGASRITRDVTSIISQVPEVIEALTGIDVIGSIKNLRGVMESDSGGDGSGSGTVVTPPPAPPGAPRQPPIVPDEPSGPAAPAA
jgi:flotillin